MDHNPKRSGAYQFTIGSLMRDVTIAAIGFAGFANRDDPNPILVTASWFALVYFVTKLLFAILPFLPRLILKSEVVAEPRRSDPEDTVAESKKLLIEAHTLLLEEKSDQALPILEGLVETYPRHAVSRNLLGYALSRLGRIEEARSAFCQAESLADETTSPTVSNNIAWSNYLLARDELKSEADRYSQMAIERQPEEASVLGTRGAILIWTDRPEEGMALLARSLATTTNPRSRASNLCSMALGCVALRRREAAISQLAEARTLDPLCPLLERVEQAIETFPAAMPGPSSPIPD